MADVIEIKDTMITLNGVVYVPKSTVVSDQVLQALSQAYGIAWSNGYYDPICSHSVETLRKISDFLAFANKELHFKR